MEADNGDQFNKPVGSQCLPEKASVVHPSRLLALLGQVVDLISL